jgi:PAS domain S-box-containing protein
MVGLAVSTLVIGALALHFVEDHLVASSGGSLALAAADIADKLDRLFSERSSDLRIAAAPAFVREDAAAMTEALSRMKQAYPFYLWLGATDKAGRIVAATDPSTVGKDRSRTSWFRTVRGITGGHIQDVESSEETRGIPVVSFMAPIKGTQGEFLGVLRLCVDLQALEDVFAHTASALKIQRGAQTRIEWQFLTRNGEVIADSLLGQEGTVNLLRLGVPSARLSLAGGFGYMEEEHLRRHVPVVTGYAQVRATGLHWGVLVRMDRNDILAPIRAILLKLGLAGAIVCIPLFGLLLWANRRLRHEWQRAGEEARRATEAEARMQAHEVRTRLMVDRALDAIITLDDGGRITGWNLQAEVVFGWSREDAMGRSLSGTVLPSACGEALDQALIHYSESSEGLVLNRRIEVTAQHRHGYDFPVEISISPLRTHQELSFSIFARDLTHRW